MDSLELFKHLQSELPEQTSIYHLLEVLILSIFQMPVLLLVVLCLLVLRYLLEQNHLSMLQHFRV